MQPTQARAGSPMEREHRHAARISLLLVGKRAAIARPDVCRRLTRGSSFTGHQQQPTRRHENTCRVPRATNRGTSPDGSQPALSFRPTNDKSGNGPRAAAWATERQSRPDLEAASRGGAESAAGVHRAGPAHHRAARLRPVLRGHRARHRLHPGARRVRAPPSQRPRHPPRPHRRSPRPQPTRLTAHRSLGYEALHTGVANAAARGARADEEAVPSRLPLSDPARAKPRLGSCTVRANDRADAGVSQEVLALLLPRTLRSLAGESTPPELLLRIRVAPVQKSLRRGWCGERVSQKRAES